MATPFFKGNYGSALARIDTTPIMQSGIQQGQMYANMGKQFGGMIKQYGLNKQKKEKATKEVEDELLLNPQYAIRMTTSGDEVADKKNQNILDRLAKGDLKLAELEGLAGTFARMGKQDDKDRDDALALLKSQLTQTQIAQGMAGIDSTKVGTKKTEQEIALEEGDQTKRENFYNALNTELHAAQAKKETNQPLTDREKLLDVNAPGIRSRTVDPKLFDVGYGEKEKLDLVKSQTAKEVLSAKEMKRGQKEAKAPPEFSSLEDLNNYSANLPEGYEVDVVKHGTGYNVDRIKISEKDRADSIKSVDGFPDYKIIGAYLYKSDPSTKTMSKVESGQFGQNLKLLNTTIDNLNDETTQMYATYRLHTTETKDGNLVGTYTSSETGEEVDFEVPVNTVLDKRLRYLEELRKKQMEYDFDFDLRQPSP
jgi:hypothetical protein